MDLYISTEVWSLVGLKWIKYTYYSNAKEVKKLNFKSLLILTCIKNIGLWHSPQTQVSVFLQKGTEGENKLWNLYHLPYLSTAVIRSQISEIQLRIPPRNHTYLEVMWLKRILSYPVIFKIFKIVSSYIKNNFGS